MNYMQISVTVPLFSVAAGVGIQYIETKHLEKILLALAIVGIAILPFRFAESNASPSDARIIIQQLDTIPDGSAVLYAALHDNCLTGICGGLDISIKYYNYKERKSIVSVPVPDGFATMESAMDYLKKKYGRIYYYDIPDLEEWWKWELKEWK